MNWIKRLIRSETCLALLLIALTAVISYGPLITQLGYYRDDWYLVWAGLTRGWRSIFQLFLSDRPMMGAIYAVEYALLGPSPLPWHLWAFVLRLLGAFGLLWLLRMLWPTRRLETTLMCILFLVYPGFLQQPVANTFQNHFMTYLLAIFSIALTVLAFRSPRRWVRLGSYLLSLPLAASYFVIYEYFIGLEGLRLLCLWLISKDKAETIRQRIRWSGLRFIPYLGLAAAFLFWRVFVFKSTRPTTNISSLSSGFLGNPLLGIARIGIETIKDMIETVLTGWFYPLYQLTYRAGYKEWVVSVLLALGAAALIAAYAIILRKRYPVEPATDDQRWGRLLAVLGFLTVLVTLIPMVLAGRDVHFDSQFDRYTLQSTIGVAMLIGGLLWGYVRPAGRLPVILILTALAVMTHFHNGIFHRDLWQVEKKVWEQLAWRAPQIEPGTTIILSLPDGYGMQEDYEIWVPANMTYYPEDDNPTIYADLLSPRTLRLMAAGSSEGRSTRTFYFTRDYQKVILVSIPNLSACVRVINSANPVFGERENPYVMLAARYSDPSLIITEGQAASPLEPVFGAPAGRGWCYFYEQAELNNQRGNYEETVRLGQEALSEGYLPLDHTEWLPFFEAYAQLGEFRLGLDFAAAQGLSGYSTLQPLCSAIETSQNPDGLNVEDVLAGICSSQ